MSESSRIIEVELRAATGCSRSLAERRSGLRTHGVVGLVFPNHKLIRKRKELKLTLRLEFRIIGPSDLERSEKLSEARHRRRILEGLKLEHTRSQLLAGRSSSEVAVSG